MQAQDGPKLRTGFTTGACAAAAARAATRVFLAGPDAALKLSTIDSILPNRQEVCFALQLCTWENDKTVCSIIKDGGDDPDCTHGAEIIAKVRLTTDAAVEIVGGQGVAMVTRPGLGLPVGQSAINPVPRQNIEEMVRLELQGSPFRGAWVEISCPDGEERAKKTLNARLGLIGGISILGTTGIVLPYSTSAFIASVIQAIQLAHADGLDELVFTTGGRSEQYAMKLKPHLPESAFIQVGDYVGIGLRHAVRNSMRKVSIVAMMGKLSKMADGRMMTHASASEVNMELLARLAGELGASAAQIDEIKGANTARHVLEICQKEGLMQLPHLICVKTKEICQKFAREPLEMDVTMVDFNGTVLGSDRASANEGASSHE